MTREEAITIIRKEYLCVDRDCDIERSCGKCDLMMPSKEPILEAYKLAIKALEQEPKTDNRVKNELNRVKVELEQEPCEPVGNSDKLDCISRENLLKKCVYVPIAPIIKGDGVHYENVVFAKDIINAEPIQQEPKTDILDKIRTEIADAKEDAEITFGHPLGFDRIATYDKCLQIIDKYRQEG